MNFLPGLNKDKRINDQNLSSQVENSHDVSVFQQITNNIKNYVLDIPTGVVFGIFGGISIIIFGIVYIIWYNQFSSTPMGGHLNILVEPFVEKHALGYYKSDLGWNVAQIISEDLKIATEDEFELNFTVLGPSDGMPTIWGIKESDLELRAQKCSEQMNAQIVVYGVITEDKFGDPLVSVRFYISPTNFGDAQELIHGSLLGELLIGSFRLTGDTVSGSDLLDQNKELRERVEVFTFLIKGLGSYISQDFDKAKNYFELASDQRLWSNQDGLEVVYLLSGNLFLRKTRVLLDDLLVDDADQTADQTADFFNQALEISRSNNKGDYARAYLGLAGLENFYAIVEARIKNDVSLIDENALIRQEEYLQKALDADYAPTTADVDEKVAYNRAQIALAYYSLLRDDGYLDTAQLNYQSIIDAYKKGNERLTEFAALSYSGLAVVDWIRNIPDSAITNYLTAFETTRNPALKAQVLLNIGRIYDEEKDYQNALEYYKEAIARRNDLERVVKEKDIEYVVQRIRDIEIGELQ